MFGAEGIGLCRTEHMFFEGDRIKAVREMILADDEAGRRVALAKLLPMQRSDFEGLFKAMQGHPVTVRLLDPPLHEFVPHFEKEQRELAKDMNVSLRKKSRPKWSCWQKSIRCWAIAVAVWATPIPKLPRCRPGPSSSGYERKETGIPVHVEIMVPLVGNHKELRYQKNIIDQTAEKVFAERNDRLEYMVGTMIEVPRAAVTAHQIAEVAEFFSFGTNDLTQMTLGFSRDDIAKFLPIYLEKGILKNDPFQILDRNGVGQLIREAVFKGRGTRETSMRHLRRTRRRTFVGGVLPLRRSELRELLSVPRAHRTPGGSACGSQRGIKRYTCDEILPNQSVREDFYNHDRQLLFSELLRHRRIVVGIGESVGPNPMGQIVFHRHILPYILLLITRIVRSRRILLRSCENTAVRPVVKYNFNPMHYIQIR